MKRLFPFFVLLQIVISAQAVPAHPGIIDYIQPNGDTLQVRLIGDERFHFYTTADGLLLQKNEKAFFAMPFGRNIPGKKVRPSGKL